MLQGLFGHDVFSHAPNNDIKITRLQCKPLLGVFWKELALMGIAHPPPPSPFPDTCGKIYEFIHVEESLESFLMT